MRRYISALVCVLIVALTSVSFVVQALPTQSIGTWAPNGTLAGAPTGASVVTLSDGRTLVIGGTMPDDTPTSAVMLYDAEVNATGAVGQLTAARNAHAAAVLKDGRVIVIGGVVEGATSADIEIFDPATGESTVVASLTSPRSQHAAAALLDGTVLIVGGRNAAGVPLADAEIFTVGGAHTTPAANSMSTARAGLTATSLLDGRVLIVGGNNGSDLGSAELYYAESQTFDPLTTSLSRTRSGHSAVLLRHNGGVLIAGGSSDTAAQVNTDLFLPPIFPDPFSYGDSSFARTGDLGAARAGAAAGNAVDGYAFAAGGGAQSAEVYRFATVQTDKDDYAPGEYALITGTGWEPNSTVTLLFQEDPPVHPDYTRVNVPTDGDGNFSVNDWAPEEHDLDVRFYLTVSDATSRAQTTFTDGRFVNKVELTYSGTTITCNAGPTPCTGNLTVPPGATISAKIFVTTNSVPGTGNDKWESTLWRVDATPPGTTTCADHGDYVGENLQHNETFAITSPGTSGTYNAYFRASNNDACAGNLSDLFTFANSITVASSNTPPVLAAIGSKAVNELALLAFTATAIDTDVPANVLTFSLAAGTTSCGSVTSCAVPSGASINSSTGDFSWTPTEAQGPGTYQFNVVVTDDATTQLSDSEEITVTVSEVNAAPVLNAIGAQAVNEGSLLSFTATATDSDTPPNDLTFSLDAGAPAGAAITPGGAFTWTPTEAQGPGSYPVTIRVADNGVPSADDFETITVTVSEVNVAPVLGAIGNKTVNEGALLTFTATVTDADVPFNTLAFSLVGGPAGASIDPSTGVFTWTPSEADGGNTFTLEVRATDNGTPPLFDNESITVTVNEVNAPPVVNAIGNQTVSELVELTFAASATDSDVPADTLTYSLIGAPPGASINASTGAFSWTPTETQGPGIYPVTLRVTDNGTPILYDEEAITITVNEVNVAPVLDAIGNRSVDEGTPLSFTATAADADLPANTMTFSLDAAPAGATINPTTGVFSWTPTEAQGPAVNSVTIRVTDNGAPAMSDFETIEVTVKEVNLAPVLTAIGNQTVNEGVLLSVAATATDPDLPANTLTFTLDAGAPLGASITAAGAFTWTPSEDQGPGDYSVTVRVTDNGTPALDDFETFSIHVNEVNAAPVLTPIGPKSVNEGAPLSFTAIATDVDIPANSLTFTLGAGAPTGASITPAGLFSWTPTEVQGPGVYNVTIVVTDDGIPVLNDSEAITITVDEVNVAPLLGAIGNKSVNELTPLFFTASATDVDLPANVLTFSLVSGPLGASINPTTGQFNWTPTEGQGPNAYTFGVRATDNGTPPLFAEETITVTVAEVNVAPTLAPIGSKLVLLGNPLTFTASASDPDLPLNTLTFSLGAGAPAGASINGVTGAFTWTPTAAQAGVHSITVIVSDNGVPSLSDSETITVTVQYSTCLLYDTTKSHKKGSTIPIKLYLCDTAGNNVSSPGTVVNATGVVKVDPSASSAVVDDSGNANPDFNFRYDVGLGVGGGYIFNLSTKTAGYNTGTWKVVFTVNGIASTAAYIAPFDIR